MVMMVTKTTMRTITTMRITSNGDGSDTDETETPA